MCQSYWQFKATIFTLLGFLERELTKDNIAIIDNGDNPLAPLPKEMNELEVCIVDKIKLMNVFIMFVQYITTFFLYVYVCIHLIIKIIRFGIMIFLEINCKIGIIFMLT